MRKTGQLAFVIALIGCFLVGPSLGNADDRRRDAPNVGQHLKYGKQSNAHGKHHDRRDVHHNRHKAPDKWHGKHDRRDRYAPPPVKWGAHKHHPKPKPHAHRHHGPKYVYVKHVHTPRYWGRHLYRGFYWPFPNVNIVLPLSARQIEHHHQAIYIALDASVGHVSRWHDGPMSGSVVVLREGVNSYGSLCREYRQTLSEPGRTVSRVEISCLDPHGYWIPI